MKHFARVAVKLRCCLYTVTTKNFQQLLQQTKKWIFQWTQKIKKLRRRDKLHSNQDK